MGRNARKRISYVLPLAESTAGHRLGVNGLAVDPNHSILYTGGRDGVICAWDLNLDLSARGHDGRSSSVAPNEQKPKPPVTTLRQQVQAHTHWINDIVLAQNNEALISASSDISVKLWRPAAQDAMPPQTIGLHSDYVKVLASPGPHAGWVASGGLDRKICLWDLNGTGQQSQIVVGEDPKTEKGSVYALAVTDSLVAAGGPESVVRIWDPRSGKRITNFVGHTDNVRDVLINQDGDTIMTASSDQTVKVWSMTAGRCMYTLTMHNDSVWSLYSDHPQLSLFYSSDRSGLVAKTDVRNCADMDEGISVAVCQEHEGVNKVVNAGNYIWTSTSSSSINRWVDVDTDAEVALSESYRLSRTSIATTRTKYSSSPTSQSSPPARAGSEKLPMRALLRISNTAPYPVYQAKDSDSTLGPVPMVRKPSDIMVDHEPLQVAPVRSLPDFSIEGQNGLIKHVLLNDRRRVLTLDTAGEVILWDLLQCAPIKSFGKRHLEDVSPEVNTTEAVAHWCAVDTRTGSLTCVLEENYCFDAEMYADELKLEENIEFREDQRINLGKWILRYLFSNLIDEEIKRDEVFRNTLVQEKKPPALSRANPPASIQIPDANLNNGWHANEPTSASTLRVLSGSNLPLQTPGLAIGLATPAQPAPPSVPNTATGALPATAEEGPQLEKTMSQQSHGRPSTDRAGDYFSGAAVQQAPTTPGPHANGKPNESHEEMPPQSPSEEKEPHEEGGKTPTWGKKFKMSFGMKKLGKTTTNEAKAPIVEEKAEDSDSRSSKTDERSFEDNFHGAIQRIRHGYEEQLQEGADSLTPAITPSLPNETPVLKPPLNTTILIQEDRPDSGGVADLFEGTVGSVGKQADIIEKVAPMWLAEVLLRNQIPPKDIVKVSFVLEPYQDQLPSIASDGNNRLNANRMLRARKILAYVAERIEPMPEHPDPNALKPEEYLELYCQDKLIPPTMTLATIRAHVWRGGGDVLLHYKPNGRKQIKHAPMPQAGEATESSDRSAANEAQEAPKAESAR